MNDRRPFDPDSPALAVALVVRFVLEIALLLASAVIVWRLVDGPLQWPLTVAAPVLLAIVWALIMSPKAPVQLPAGVKLLCEAVLFIGAGAALFMFGYVIQAGIGVIVWIAHRIALALFDDE